MSLPRVQATVHHQALDRLHGVDAVYRPHDSTKAIELRLVPGRLDQNSYEIDDEDVSSQAIPWLALNDHFVDFVGRQPEQRDEIDVEYPDGRRTFRVERNGEPRPWKFTDTHAVQIRIQSIEIEPHDE